MQKDSRPGTPKAPSAKKTRNPITPESRKNAAGDVTMPTMNRTTNLRHRATMAPTDMVLPAGLVTKRRIGNPFKMNITSQFQSSGPMTLKNESENNGDELSLLYDKYLQSLAIEMLLKRKVAEKEKCVNTQLVNLIKEQTAAGRKLDKEKNRENDIRNLSHMQNNVDAQLIDVNAALGNLKENQIKQKLLELKSLLEPIDQLRCNGIIIPQSSEELEEFEKILSDVVQVLENIRESIGQKGIVYEEIKNGLEIYTRVVEEIRSGKKKFEEVLCSLEALVLKVTSHTLYQTETGDID